MDKPYIADLAARLYREAESVRLGVNGPSVRAILLEAAKALEEMEE